MSGTCSAHQDIYSAMGEAHPGYGQEYWDKQIHDVPLSSVVDRELFIADRCRSKRVLNIGSTSGGLHEKIKAVAAVVWGIDKESADFIMDLDGDFVVPEVSPELIVAGEILEHLTNPGSLLQALKWYRAPLVVTIPNAHASVNIAWTVKGKENVNRDHVAWYSYNTAKCLFEKCRWRVSEFYWYNGQPRTAEGLVFVVV